MQEKLEKYHFFPDFAMMSLAMMWVPNDNWYNKLGQLEFKFEKNIGI